jgi:hypothetical protein
VYSYIYIYIYIYIYVYLYVCVYTHTHTLLQKLIGEGGARGSVVVKTLCYKPECRGFETLRGE